MDFIQKKTTHDRLMGVTHLQADRALLAKLAPGHDILKRGVFIPTNDASETLFALLDFVSEEQIVFNRRAHAAGMTAEELSRQEEEQSLEIEEKAKADQEAEEKAEAAEDDRLKAELDDKAKSDRETAEKAEQKPQKSDAAKSNAAKNPKSDGDAPPVSVSEKKS